MIRTLISSDAQAREAMVELNALKHVLSSEQLLSQVVRGLPMEVVDGVRKSLRSESRELEEVLAAYNEAKAGNFEPLTQRAGGDPGAMLIVARIARGLSQKELARKLGLREQAVQRYEAEKYRSISLANYLKFAGVLGADLRISLSNIPSDGWIFAQEISPPDIRKALKHARANGWLDSDEASDEDAISQLKRHVAEHVARHGAPSLLRTGLNVVDHSSDWSLLLWKAQVTRRAEVIIADQRVDYRQLEFGWLLDLVRLSVSDDGPVQAVQLLQKNGIVLVIEPHIVGMKVDGAAFLVGDTPVIGMTLLRDTLDNFWFTLMHEVAHIVLHYRTGLRNGFFDEFREGALDEIEEEANRFASSLLIPEEVWRRSPARIAKSAAPIDALAKQLGIHPAIIFGRVRKERDDYSIFTNRIGQGIARKLLLPGKEI